MPIVVNTDLRIFTQDQFRALDYPIMGVIFQVHNEFGRFLDEDLFKRAIAIGCASQGIEPVDEEVRIRVTHESFSKDYFMDLLFARGLMVEAKTVESLAPAHRSQALNYLFLTGMKHGRLVNLRPERVQHEFVSTSLDADSRHNFTVVDCSWRIVNPASEWLKDKFVELVSDWGAFLEVNLYRDAIIHFLGGPEVACPEVELLAGSQVLGRQQVCLLAEDTAFTCTAITQSQKQMGEHQRRFLAHTRLRTMQWINLNHSKIEFTTISK